MSAGNDHALKNLCWQSWMACMEELKKDREIDALAKQQEARYKEFMSKPRPPGEETTNMVTGFVFDDELLDSLGEAEDGGDVLDVRYIVQSRLEDFFGDAPFGVDVNEATDTIDEPNFEEAVKHIRNTLKL